MSGEEITEQQIENLAKVLQREMSAMSGDVLFDVNVEWCEDHRIKTFHGVYRAKRQEQVMEELIDTYDRDGCSLRKLEIRWLCPVECVHEVAER